MTRAPRRRRHHTEALTELIPPRCGALDVPQKTVVVWARRAAAGAMTPEVHPFGTTTRARLALADWLAGRGITPGAMASTGVF